MVPTCRNIIIIEGQGGLFSPGYTGGVKILNAVRPEVLVLQHAPTRKTYEDFPDFPMHPLETQISALELLCQKRIAALTLHSQGIPSQEIDVIAAELSSRFGRLVCDPLTQGVEPITDGILCGLDAVKST